jgi:DNA-binding HxlR family transcriptional regulator
MSNSDFHQPIAKRKSAPIPLDRCGMALACDLLGDRWMMLILREAFYGVSRFDDLRADLRIPRGILSERLKKLLIADVLEKTPYREGTSRVRHEYHLTPRGHELGVALIALMQWGDKHLQSQPSLLRIIDKVAGSELIAGLISNDGKAINLDQARMEILAKS